MQDILVSALLKKLQSWEAAFPDGKLLQQVSTLVSPSVSDAQQPVVFWLHLHAGLNLSQTIAVIVNAYPNARVVVLDNDPSHDVSLQALSAGAMGYAHAYSAPQLLTEIKAVISHGGIWLGQPLLQRLIETSVQMAGSSPDYVEGLLKKLTKREQQVALEAAKGLSNKEIARVLEITERTVKAHLAATFERLHVKDRLQLALMLTQQPRGEVSSTKPAVTNATPSALAVTSDASAMPVSPMPAAKLA